MSVSEVNQTGVYDRGRITSDGEVIAFLQGLKKLRLRQQFIDSFLFFTPPDENKGIWYSYNYTSEQHNITAEKVFLIGKHIDDLTVEVTIKGGRIVSKRGDVENPPHYILKVCLDYEGNDIDFEPTQPPGESWYHRWGFVEQKKQSNREKFPLYRKEMNDGYGAVISHAGLLDKPIVMVKVKDKRLEVVAQKMYERLTKQVK